MRMGGKRMGGKIRKVGCYREEERKNIETG